MGKTPTVAMKATMSMDGGYTVFDGQLTARELSELLRSHLIYVIEDEQRGNDPVTGQEVLNRRKVDNWIDMEVDGELSLGQLTFATHSEANTEFEYTDDGVLSVFGGSTIVDGRQRTYTVNGATERAENHQADDYDPDTRKVSVRFYVGTDTTARREIFAQMNGARGGDHADQSRSAWLSPRGAAIIAKKLVLANRHLGNSVVNTVTNKVAKDSTHLAGFNTFVRAVETAWNLKGKAVSEEMADEVSNYLDRFWSAVVAAVPQLGKLSAPERQQLRDTSLLGNPLIVYGLIAVAKSVYMLDKANPPLDRLDALADLAESGWFDLTDENGDPQSHWRDMGVMAPVFDIKTHKVAYWRPRNAFQTRKSLADALVRRMFDPAAVVS